MPGGKYGSSRKGNTGKFSMKFSGFKDAPTNYGMEETPAYKKSNGDKHPPFNFGEGTGDNPAVDRLNKKSQEAKEAGNKKAARKFSKAAKKWKKGEKASEDNNVYKQHRKITKATKKYRKGMEALEKGNVEDKHGLTKADKRGTSPASSGEGSILRQNLRQKFGGNKAENN